MLSFCLQISSAVNTSGVLLLPPSHPRLAIGKWKATPGKQEVVVGVAESVPDKGLRVELLMPLESIPSARHWDQGPQEKQTTYRIKSVCVQHFKSFVHSNLELPALEAATCSLLPLCLPVQTWGRKTNHDPSWPLSELSLGHATAVTPANSSSLAQTDPSQYQRGHFAF